ncbi:lysylphosphatidylglycerol synthase transmembrane domain-containing protein [Limibacterium fermenti]|uniref:lysylphosphatidylglycerol synthase transmembrane domain-containing protein n=1 Tax=Limibacterium fermenti TaxID=3229863 RepID=UPI000E81D0EA|nr:hypothetical protein [Porphyromonadaceae bacterium]
MNHWIAFVKKYRHYFIIGLLLIVGLFIARFISGIDFRVLLKYLREMPEMMLRVLLVSFLGYLSASFAWMLCLGDEMKKVSFVDIFIFRHVGEMLGAFNPTGVIAGDGLKAACLHRKGVKEDTIFSSLLLYRALAILSSIFLIVLSVLFLSIGKINSGQSAFVILAGVAVLALIATVLVMFLMHRNLYFGKLMEKMRRVTKWGLFSDKFIESCYSVNKALSVYIRQHRNKFIGASLLSVLQWVFGAMEFYIVLNALGVGVSLADAVSVEMGVVLFKMIGAVVPGQLGIEELGNKVMLEAIGVVSNEVWLVVSIMRRARQLFWVLIAGVFSLMIMKTKQIKIRK